MPRLPDIADLQRPIPRSQRPVVTDQSGQIIGRALENAGGEAADLMDRRYANSVNLARAQASNALLDHEIAVRNKADDIRQRVESGDLPYAEARQTFDQEASAIERPQITHLDPVGQQNFTKGLDRNVFTGQISINKAVDAAEKTDFRDQFTGALDRLGKLAGMPGTDIAEINAKADAYVPQARAAGIPSALIDKTIQDFKDRNWLNNATQNAMESADSLPDLRQLQHDLTAADGFYAGKLDTDKRNAVLRSVLSDISQIELRAAHQADRREAKAERAIAQIDQQISTGIPATAAQWASWDSVTRDTSQTGEFQSRMKDEEAVQGVLRKPMADQVAYVQEETRKLDTEGGTLRDRANLARLTNTVKANVQQFQTAPLLFNANRTGAPIAPLDLMTLFAAPDGQAQIANQIQSRMTTLGTMRKEYGQVPTRPLLPQEAQQMGAMLNAGTPAKQVEMLGALRSAIADTEAYRGALQQIAPDQPVTALAGMVATHDAPLTLKTHWFKPNEMLSGAQVAQTLLEGEHILDATKLQKSEDGRPKTGLYMPNDSALQTSFQLAVKDAFAGRQDAAQVAFQAVKAYYTGRAAQTGRLASTKQDIDNDLVDESVKMVLGGVDDYNGNGAVLLPWGMPPDDFEDRAQAALVGELKTRGMPEGLSSSDYGLRNLGEGSYYVTSGRAFVLDPKGKPLTIQVTQ